MKGAAVPLAAVGGSVWRRRGADAATPPADAPRRLKHHRRSWSASRRRPRTLLDLIEKPVHAPSRIKRPERGGAASSNCLARASASRSASAASASHAVLSNATPDDASHAIAGKHRLSMSATAVKPAAFAWASSSVAERRQGGGVLSGVVRPAREAFPTNRISARLCSSTGLAPFPRPGQTCESLWACGCRELAGRAR